MYFLNRLRSPSACLPTMLRASPAFSIKPSGSYSSSRVTDVLSAPAGATETAPGSGVAGAYTLAKNGHVRGDVLYGFFPPRLQAGLDLVLYFVFFIPGIVALVWAGYTYAAESWAIQEHSTLTANGPPLYHFKTTIPIAGVLLLMQGVVEIIRCVICLRDGVWPLRQKDVEEVDVEKLKEMVHVKDEDIASLDKYAGAKAGDK